MTHRFQTTIQLNGKTATGLEVPADVVSALGTGKKPPVRVTIGGHTYRSTVAVYGGVYMLPLSAENRSASGVKAGDHVTVELDLDTAQRVVDVPPILAAALQSRPRARAAWGALSYSKQRERVLAVESAKREETRDGRIRKIVDELASE